MSEEQVVNEEILENNENQEVQEQENVLNESQEVENQVIDTPEVQAETKEELKDEVEKAIDEGATEEQVADMVREFELKVNGKVIKKKFDFSNESDIENLKRELQMGEANKQGMQKASEYEKAYQAFLEEAKSNPWKILEELGYDPTELAESRLSEEVEQLKKSPDQIEKERIQSELEEARAKLKEQEELAKQAEFEQMKQSEILKFNQDVDEALSATKSLPKTQKTVSRIADAMIWAMEQGYENVSVEDVIPLVEQDIRREMNDLLDVLPDEFMEQYIGKKNIDRLRKKRLEAHSKSVPSIDNVRPVTKKEVKESSEDKPKISQKDFFRNLRG